PVRPLDDRRRGLARRGDGTVGAGIDGVRVQRQRERERRSLAGAAPAEDRAAVSLDDRAHDRQPEAGTGDVARRAAAEEPLEQSWLLFLRDARAGVRDAR